MIVQLVNAVAHTGVGEPPELSRGRSERAGVWRQ